MGKLNHKNHVATGLKVVLVCVAIMIALSAISIAAPFVLAVFTALFPFVAVIAGIAICIWLLGFLINAGKAGVNKVDINNIKRKFKKS